MSPKSRTELIIGVSGATFHEETDFHVPDYLAPQNPSKKNKKLISEIKFIDFFVRRRRQRPRRRWRRPRPRPRPWPRPRRGCTTRAGPRKKKGAPNPQQKKNQQKRQFLRSYGRTDVKILLYAKNYTCRHIFKPIRPQKGPSWSI